MMFDEFLPPLWRNLLQRCDHHVDQKLVHSRVTLERFLEGRPQDTGVEIALCKGRENRDMRALCRNLCSLYLWLPRAVDLPKNVRIPARQTGRECAIVASGLKCSGDSPLRAWTAM
jgi:hypothetical protein